MALIMSIKGLPSCRLDEDVPSGRDIFRMLVICLRALSFTYINSNLKYDI